LLGSAYAFKETAEIAQPRGNCVLLANSAILYVRDPVSDK